MLKYGDVQLIKRQISIITRTLMVEESKPVPDTVLHIPYSAYDAGAVQVDAFHETHPRPCAPAPLLTSIDS